MKGIKVNKIVGAINGREKRIVTIFVIKFKKG